MNHHKLAEHTIVICDLKMLEKLSLLKLNQNLTSCNPHLFFQVFPPHQYRMRSRVYHKTAIQLFLMEELLKLQNLFPNFLTKVDHQKLIQQQKRKPQHDKSSNLRAV